MVVQIMQFAEAEADCDRALKREISVKTLLRRGTARRGKHDLEGARADFKQVLALEPKNRRVAASAASIYCRMFTRGGMVRKGLFGGRLLT